MADSLNLELESNAEEYELTLGDDSQRYLELTVEDRMYEVDKGGGSGDISFFRTNGNNDVVTNVDEIGYGAFFDWESLKSVDLIKATILGKGCFYNCEDLETLILRSPTFVAFSNCGLLYSKIGTGGGYIYVPDALVDSYKTATGWNDFESQIKPLSELPSE